MSNKRQILEKYGLLFEMGIKRKIAIYNLKHDKFDLPMTVLSDYERMKLRNLMYKFSDCVVKDIPFTKE